VLGQKIGPHHDVPVFDIRQACVDILLLRVRLGGAEETVQVRRIRFILPVVLERVYVDLPDTSARLGGLECRRHGSISQQPVDF